MPEHWLHIYQRPAQGERFIARYPAFSYKHKLTAAGGFDTANCELAVSRSVAERFLRDYLGCRVAVYVDNPGEPIWEGFINRASLNTGTVVYTRSLDELFNRVSGIYTDRASSSTTTHVTAVNNLTSQAIYGIKESSPENWADRSDNTRITAIRDRILSQQAWPDSSVVYSSDAGVGLLQLDLLGFYHMLDWVKVIDTNTTDRQFSAGSSTLLYRVMNASGAEVYPNSFVFDTSDFSLVADNTKTGRPNALTGLNITYWAYIQKLQEAGDGTNLWVAGITATDLGGMRRFYFRQANTDVDYIIRSVDGKVRDRFGQIVKPWRVRPDRRVRMNDVQLGFYDDDQDPRTFYADTVDYDAENLAVRISSSDDIYPEGAFKLKQKHKNTGQRFGVVERFA